jgi:uncharacterized protein (UPF0335 family)
MTAEQIKEYVNGIETNIKNEILMGIISYYNEAVYKYFNSKGYDSAIIQPIVDRSTLIKNPIRA